MALSHTWGPFANILTTTQRTIEQRKQRISLASLPANFRDAVEVAQAFHVRHLWIDSLCIVQDSDVDWASESARMHLIYASAYFTIAATRATTATDGFLQHRLRKDIAALLYTDEARNQTAEFNLSIREGHWLGSDHDTYVEDSTWNQRGWTLQERILSRRVLHFTYSMLYFECRSSDWMEDNRPSRASLNRTPWLGSSAGGWYDDRHLESPTKSLYDSWYLILEHYSQRSLTETDDKLPALSGVAHEMARLSGDTYIAGLWKNDLSASLLWNPVGIQSRPARTYRSPSWSWAQIDGHIQTDDRLKGHPEHVRRCFTLVETVVQPDGQDDMGRVRYGHLVMRARLERVTEIRPRAEDYGRGGRFTHSVYKDKTFICIGRLDVCTEMLRQDDLWALLVAEEANPAVLEGLLLEGGNAARQSFRRIGTFHISIHPDPNEQVERSDFFESTAEREICLL